MKRARHALAQSSAAAAADAAAAAATDPAAPLPCPFEACGAAFDSTRALRAHLRRHRASTPFACHVPNCSAAFVSHVRLDAHVAAAHPRHAPAPHPTSDDHACARDDQDSDPDSLSQPAGAEDTAAADKDNDDVRQLADNAAYFFSQLRIARSRKLVAWNESDIRNAHMWAVWVQNEMLELKNDHSVEPALKRRGISMKSATRAERLLVDALLAYDGLDAKLIGQIVRSAADISADSAGSSQDAANNGDGGDAAGSDVDEGGAGGAPDDSGDTTTDSLSAVAAAAVAALARKRAVAALGGAAGHVRAADARGAAGGAVAAAQGLSTSGALALRAAAAGACVTDEVRAAAQRRADWCEVDAQAMGEVCERDVTVLDAHVCALGREIVIGGRDAGDAIERVRVLAQRDG